MAFESHDVPYGAAVLQEAPVDPDNPPIQVSLRMSGWCWCGRY